MKKLQALRFDDTVGTPLHGVCDEVGFLDLDLAEEEVEPPAGAPSVNCTNKASNIPNTHFPSKLLIMKCLIVPLEISSLYLFDEEDKKGRG